METIKCCDNCINIDTDSCGICRGNKSPTAEHRNLIVDNWKLNPEYFDVDDIEVEVEKPLTKKEIKAILKSGYDYKQKPMSKRAKARALKAYNEIKDMV